MNYETIGRLIYKGYHHPINYIQNVKLSNISDEGCFCLYIIEQGSGYVGVEDNMLHFSSPALLCINEKERLTFHRCSDVRMNAIYFHPYILNPNFDYEFIRKCNNFNSVQLQDLYFLKPFLQHVNNYSGLFFLEADNFIKILKLGEQLRNELTLQGDDSWPCRSRSYFIELLILISRLYDSYQRSDNKLLPEMSENIAGVLDYLHNNYQNRITLEQLASIFATNRTTLNNQFYKITKLTVIEYLIQLRISIAAALLRDTRLPVTEIMERVGFNSNSYFWRTFKKCYNITPIEYREKYCWV